MDENSDENSYQGNVFISRNRFVDGEQLIEKYKGTI